MKLTTMATRNHGQDTTTNINPWSIVPIDQTHTQHASAINHYTNKRNINQCLNVQSLEAKWYLIHQYIFNHVIAFNFTH